MILFWIRIYTRKIKLIWSVVNLTILRTCCQLVINPRQPPHLSRPLTIKLQTSNMFVQSYKHSHTLIQTLFVKHILNNEELYTNTTTDNQTWFVQTPFVANFFGDHTPSNIKPQTCVCANHVWSVWGCFFVWQNVWKFLIKLKNMITNMNK